MSDDGVQRYALGGTTPDLPAGYHHIVRPSRHQDDAYRVALTPDTTLVVEESGNVVLVTPERRVTVTHVQRWIDELTIARQIAGAVT